LRAAAITKLDVLSGLEKIGIVTAYSVAGKPAAFASAAAPRLEIEVEYVPGWSDDITGVTRIGHLPGAARAYVKRIEASLGAPVECVSVGPERSQLAV
jgi:adenylosuccinate synthase